MMRAASLLLLGLAVAAPAWSAASSESLAEGQRFELLATSPMPPFAPASPFFSVEVVDVQDTTVTVRWTAEGWTVREATYDRSSRANVAGSDYLPLYVTSEDVANGFAWLDHEFTQLSVLGSGAIPHEFASGNSDWRFDATSGLFLSRENHAAPGAVVRYG